MVLGVYENDDDDEPILDPIYVIFLSFKKRVLEWISACGFLHRALYFYSNPYARAQIAATIATLPIWTLKMSGSTARYILPSQQAATKFLVRAAIAWLFKILQIWGVGERGQGPPYRNLISKYWFRYSHVIYNKFVIEGVYLNSENLRLIRANFDNKPNTTYQTTPLPSP